jgi:ubiquinone/menaquinone biosynthesis C-methylase UbiE
MFKKIKQLLVNLKYKTLEKYKLNNSIINRYLYPIEFKGFNSTVIRERLTITSQEYKKYLEFEELSRFKLFDFHHSKVLDYIVTSRLIDSNKENQKILDAASGNNTEYLDLVCCLGIKFTGYYQDLLAKENTKHKHLEGDLDSTKLSDNTLDFVSCHHSFEHFRGTLDIDFINEMIRILKPGGRLCIAPLFIANEYCEIWNIKTNTHFDHLAKIIYDPTATFPGWGPYEHFARVYSNEIFNTRIIEPIIDRCKVIIFDVFLENKKVPDIFKNQHQPLVNADMKVLCIEKI